MMSSFPGNLLNQVDSKFQRGDLRAKTFIMMPISEFQTASFSKQNASSVKWINMRWKKTCLSAHGMISETHVADVDRHEALWESSGYLVVIASLYELQGVLNDFTASV